MKYTKYFAQVGVPNLSESQFKRYMNIVHREGKIEGLKKAQNLTPELPQVSDATLHRWETID